VCVDDNHNRQIAGPTPRFPESWSWDTRGHTCTSPGLWWSPLPLPCITRESKRKYEMTHRQANIFMDDNAEERRGEDRQNPSVSLQIHRNRFMVSTEVFSSTLRKNGAATKCQSLTCKRHAPCTSGGGLELRSMRGGLLGDLPFHRHHRYTTASVLPPTTNDLPPCSRKCNETKQGGRPDDGSRRQHGWLAIQ
jgi:hypothetical protein